jgi:hypothetical protein
MVSGSSWAAAAKTWAPKSNEAATIDLTTKFVI